MKLYAQHGFGNGQKTMEGLRSSALGGVIFSPKDIRVAKLEETAAEVASEFPDAQRLLDPQFYATVLAVDPLCRVGNLDEDYAAYFQPRRRTQLLSEQRVIDDLRAVLSFQQQLSLTGLIAPNIVVPRSFDSAEAAIAMDFLRNTASVARELNARLPVYATLAVSRDALLDKDELLRFLNDVTVLDPAPNGFYVLISANSAEARSEVFNADVIAGWMLINHTLSLNGFEVINGYSDLLTPFLGLAGAAAGATGWWSNLRTFSLDRFNPPLGGGRLPVERYLSAALLNRVTYYELDVLRRVAPEAVNGLPSDALYSGEGSQPERSKEVLQSWDALNSLNERLVTGDKAACLRNCRRAIQLAKQLYAEASASVSFEPKSNDEHLDDLGAGLDLFERLAELNPG